MPVGDNGALWRTGYRVRNVGPWRACGGRVLSALRWGTVTQVYDETPCGHGDTLARWVERCVECGVELGVRPPQEAELRQRIYQADMALGHIEQDAINRLAEDSPMLLIDVRLLDGVIALLRGVPLAQAFDSRSSWRDGPWGKGS